MQKTPSFFFFIGGINVFQRPDSKMTVENFARQSSLTNSEKSEKNFQGQFMCNFSQFTLVLFYFYLHKSNSVEYHKINVILINAGFSPQNKNWINIILINAGFPTL